MLIDTARMARHQKAQVEVELELLPPWKDEDAKTEKVMAARDAIVIVLTLISLKLPLKLTSLS